MFSTRREFRPRLVRLFLWSTLYGSWLLGLFPFIFDTKKYQMRRSRWLILYGLIGNCCLMIILLFCAQDFSKRKLEGFERNPVLEMINILVGMLSVFAAVIMHFMNYWKSKEVEEIFNEILVMEHKDFKTLNTKKCPKFECLVIQKYATMMGQIISFLAVNFGMNGSHTNAFLVILSCLLLTSLNVNTMHYIFGILFIYRYVWLINGQLKDLVNQLRVDPTTDYSRIRQYLALYNRLLELRKKLVTAYQYQMVIVLASAVAGNIVVIYFLIVYGITLQKCSIFLMIFPQSLLINVWDFWLSISACELTEQAGRKTSTILKLFNDVEHTDLQLERNVNEFALLCSHRKFDFKLCGIFSINFSKGFQMIIASFLYLIYLVQFDYMNL
ncbi:putative gustatory receptor 22b [Drosophila eugracilis]|uniref:putative gustatory receptor 22b n=1 Tax=Drosophila eugracilis TaxID=29029 RepID=UPI001BDB0FBD|nr:putative gustatory receptor 22b [Drosophila eugracilis]